MKLNLFAIIGFAMLPMVAKAALPDWIQSPPTSDTTLYAIGEGRNLQQATDVALKNILGQLRTRVSSQFEQQQALVNDRYSESIKQRISSSVENLPISQFSALKNHKSGHTFYSLVSVDKTALIDTLSNEYTARTKKIKSQIAQKGQAGSPLEWWFSHRDDIVAEFGANLRYTEILSLLGVDTQSQSSTNDTIADQLLAIKQDSCLFVGKFHQQDIRLALRDKVVAAGISADDRHCAYQLQVKEDLQSRYLFNRHTATLKMTLVLEHQQQPLSSEFITETGSSMSGKDVAQTAAIQRMINKIRQDEGQLLGNLLKQ